MAPSLDLQSSKKELKAIVLAFAECSPASSERFDSLRFRSLVKRTDALLRHGCPFAEFDKGPPTLNNGDRCLLSLTDPPIAKAMHSLLGFATICTHLGDFPLIPVARPVYGHLRRYIPVVLAWIEILHPMNGRLQPASGAHGSQVLCRLISALLHAICLPNMHGGPEKMYEFVFDTPTITCLVDIWLNLFRYTANPPWDVVARVVELIFDFARHINVQDGSSRVASELVVSTVHQRIQNKRRRLCRVISRYGLYLKDVPRSLYVIPTKLLSVATILTLSPNIQVSACPREDMRTLVQLLDHHVATRNWAALMMGCTYLSNIWAFSLNNKTIEWAINDGIMVTVLNALNCCDDCKVTKPVQDVARHITNDFNSWRILRAFERNITGLVSDLERASERHPVIAEWLIAYCERAAALGHARDIYKEGRERCSYSQCTQSLTEPGMKPLACQGKDAWYCSERCQRAHWKEKHRQTCLFGLVTRMTQRDWRFICALAVVSMHRNLRSIVGEALALDPNRRHRMALHVDLREPAITHRVEVVEQLAPEDAWTTRLVIYWREWGKDSIGELDTAFQLDVMLEEVEKEAADENDRVISGLAIMNT
ncbi:hypothetical protein K525DRAFT_186353 [Schizophyllum commune Loenen D]|nr:hypothetical protein K525DRAFT_186353 [Schizophyllum commune Loenen D]